MEIPILFRNQHFICVDKPANMLTVPARRGESETRPILGHRLQSALGSRLWPVHRLDEPVSGAVLFAFNAQAHKAANQWFEHNLVGKLYEAYTRPFTDEQHRDQDNAYRQAKGLNARRLGQKDRNHSVVRGSPGELKGNLTADNFSSSASGDIVLPSDLVMGKQVQWTSKLLKGKKRAYVDEAHGKVAVTLATPVRIEGGLYYWHLMPKTGRSHQLRFELYRHRFPIIGDVLYGGQVWQEQGIALRNLLLDFSKCPGFEGFDLPERIEALPMEKPQ